MSALLETISRTLFRSAAAPPKAHVDACAPDCIFEYLCDGNGNYYSRQCCYRSDCTYFCGGWTHIGSC